MIIDKKEKIKIENELDIKPNDDLAIKDEQIKKMEKENPKIEAAIEKRRKSFIGMRIIKTIISVYISILFTVFIIKGQPINSAVAALLSTQDSREGSRKYGKNRILGTLIGGTFAMIYVFIIDKLNVALFNPLYYLIMTLMLIPIIKIVLHFNLKGSVASAMITFMIALMSYVSQADLKYIYVLHRIIDTFFGVLISVIINSTLPDHRKKDLEIN